MIFPIISQFKEFEIITDFFTDSDNSRCTIVTQKCKNSSPVLMLETDVNIGNKHSREVGLKQHHY